MDAPFLSVIIPAYNEESRIGKTLDDLVVHLSSKPYEWEIIVADDGSSDATAEIAGRAAAADPRIRVLRLRHGGKGWAIRNGMLDSAAEWRFMCDADLSMPAEQIDRFLPGDGAPGFDIGIGSREAAGARRIGEPALRHAIGRVFSRMTRVLALSGIDDTQCGFKMYRGSLADTVFDAQTIEGWGFDVEVLYLGRKLGARIDEIPIDWYYRTESKVGFVGGAMGFLHILKVRWRDIRGAYRPGGWRKHE